MSSPAGLRKRKDVSTPSKGKEKHNDELNRDDVLDHLAAVARSHGISHVQWDYRVALGIITIAAFATRFWGISHPNEVVFDEVHFGKVCMIWKTFELHFS